MTISKTIKKRIEESKSRFFCNDNISEFIKDGELDLLIEEVTDNFQNVLDSLIIDTDNDPNSYDTPKRLAKMYINELMYGRYYPMPNCTSFPNNTSEKYEGMLVVRSDIKSICSHHHQPVYGVAYIGIIAAERLIGLSKYTRIAQWCARRGTLQEELCNMISDEIIKATGSKNVGIYLKLSHGCCEFRGIMSQDSTTQTTVLNGAFKDDSSTKKEFFDNIQIQELKCK
jgi:GTP cyclohydrolase I